MTVQFSDSVRNSRLDAIETAVGTSPILEIRSGGQPANCAAADSGTLLSSITLPADWMAAASGGTKAKSGTWSDLAADNTGVAAHWRLKNSAGSTCHAQGSAGTSAADLLLDSTNFTAGQSFTVSSWTFTEANG